MFAHQPKRPQITTGTEKQKVCLYSQCSSTCSTFTAGLCTATQIARLCSHKNFHTVVLKRKKSYSYTQHFMKLPSSLILQDGQTKKKKTNTGKAKQSSPFTQATNEFNLNGHHFTFGQPLFVWFKLPSRHSFLAISLGKSRPRTGEVNAYPAQNKLCASFKPSAL